jgi:hypothetical protein
MYTRRIAVRREVDDDAVDAHVEHISLTNKENAAIAKS